MMKQVEYPVVSVVMANFNGASYLAGAIVSVQKQSLREIELIVSDDGSSDDSVAIVEKAIASDNRIRLIRNHTNEGPSVARNKALSVARGDWIAVMDSDDMMHPDRLSKLVEAAGRDDADIVADDLLQFTDDSSMSPRALLFGRWARRPFWVDVDLYIRLNRLYGRGPALGYLKPLIRSTLLKSFSIRYNERLRLAEDYHLVLQMLVSGAKMRVYPLLLYFYRKHHGSISHRLNESSLVTLKRADHDFWSRYGTESSKVRYAMYLRLRSIDTALQYEKLLGALKARLWLQAATIGAKRPRVLILLKLPLASRLRRLWVKPVGSTFKSARTQICVLSRQRVVGRTNGSSTYLLDLVHAVAAQNVDVHFISPSPSTLGRWPYLKLLDEMTVFQSVRVRGTLRVGRYLISLDPRRFVLGALAALDRLLAKTGLAEHPHFKRAPYPISGELTRIDQLFLAQHAPSLGDFLIADYCFLTECFAYALRPDAPTAVIMHDRFSGRSSQFTGLTISDSVSSLDEDEECRRLALAECIVAIQAEEGDWVRKKVAHREVIVTPMAAHPVRLAQQGRDDVILFVGSSAAPNIDGIKWFLDFCWPIIKANRRDAILQVIGSVCGALGLPPTGVRFLGFVKDTSEAYRDAGVVISPLRLGSGLKIKLIEALGQGKALVGTSKTLQGVEDILSNTICIEDTANGFADAVLMLLANKTARSALGTQALDVISRHFAPEVCYSEFVNRVIEARASESLLR